MRKREQPFRGIPQQHLFQALREVLPVFGFDQIVLRPGVPPMAPTKEYLVTPRRPRRSRFPTGKKRKGGPKNR